jgi:isopenicillin-N epimerase
VHGTHDKHERLGGTRVGRDTQVDTNAPIAEAGRHFLLRPDIAFLNHGSYGACPQPVFETYQQWQRTLEAQPVEFLGRRLHGLLAEARERLAAYVGAPADALVFVPNGAVERTWRFLCEQRGAHYRVQQVELPLATPEEVIERVWEGVTARTRAIVVSHITSPTALILPVAELCRRAAERGILTIVDGAHVPGQVDLDLAALGADFYTGNCHKWLCAPKGAGFLYARPEQQRLLYPLVVSWGWQARDPGPSPFQDYFEWIGTDDPAAYLSIPAAIAFEAEYEWPRVRAACHELAAEARQRIGALTDLAPMCPDTTDWWVQMCAIPLPVGGLPAEELKRRLYDDFQVEVPIVEWAGWRFVRVSIQAYNTRRDVDRLIAALRALL